MLGAIAGGVQGKAVYNKRVVNNLWVPMALMQTGVNQIALDRLFPQRAQSLQPVIAFDQHESTLAFPQPDRRLLPVLQYVIRQRLDLFGIECLGPFDRHVNGVDGDGFLFEHESGVAQGGRCVLEICRPQPMEMGLRRWSPVFT